MRSSPYVFNNHNQERKLNTQGLLSVSGAGDVVGGDVRSHDFKHGGLDVRVCEPLDVAVSHTFIPNLEGFGPKIQIRTCAEQRKNEAAARVAESGAKLTQ